MPICVFCGNRIRLVACGTWPWMHGTCETRSKTMPLFRVRQGWRGRLILQRLYGTSYRDATSPEEISQILSMSAFAEREHPPVKAPQRAP